MAELQVGIKANVGETKKIVRSIKEIRRAANDASATLQKTSLSATSATVSLQGTATTSLNLAKSQNLAAVANVAVARTLDKVAVSATRTTLAETGTTKQTNILSAALARMGNIGSAAFFKVGASAKRMGTQVRTAGASIAGLGIAGAGLGALLAVGLGVGIKSAVEFELTMSRIIGLVGIAESEVEAFKKPLLAIGKATAKGPVELAEALFFITSAGAKGADALEILEASAKAASAGLGETKAVADAVTSAMNAYGKENLSAAQSTDILVSAVREGKAAADEIAGAIGQVLPIASQLGVTFDQVGATIAALTRVGLNAALSATALKATLNALSKPGQEAVDTLSRLSKQNLEAEISFDDVRKVLREDGLIAALQLLQEVTGNNTQELQKIFPNIRAGVGVFSLLGKNAKNVAEIFERMKDSTGATDKAFEAFTNTTAFTLKEALVALQVSLQTIGESLLPAVAKAFVGLAGAVTGTVSAFEALGSAIAEAIHGSDDPYIRATNRQKELNDAVSDFGFRIQTVQKFDPVQGKFIASEIRHPLGELDKWLIKTFGINKAGIELSGTYDEQLAQLQKAAKAQNILVNLLDKEKQGAISLNNNLEDTADILDDIGDKPPIKIIDNELLTKGKKNFADLQDTVKFLTSDLTNLQELGQDGIGLQDDFEETKEIVKQLQGELGITASEVRKLVNDKRALTEAIDKVTEAFVRQDAANEEIKELATNTRDLAEQIAILQAGGSFGVVEAAQKARVLMMNLGDDTDHTKESLTQLLLQQSAYNDVLKSMPVDRADQLRTSLETIIALQDVATDDSAIAEYGRQAVVLSDAIVKAELAAAGLDKDLLLGVIPTQQAIETALEPFKKLFAEGFLNKEELENITAGIEEKFKGSFDAMEEFAIQAARNIETALADFLFDPFEDGLKGMVRSFGETLRRMTSDILANALLKSFLDSFGSSTGVLGAVAGAIGGRAEGGPVQAGRAVVVGEEGPEIFQPRQSGNIIPNGQMGGQAPAPVVEIGGPTIINTLDDSAIVAAFNRGGGSDVILNNMTENRAAFRNALGIS